MKNKILRKDDILGGTLKQNLDRITKSYYDRNGIVEKKSDKPTQKVRLSDNRKNSR